MMKKLICILLSFLMMCSCFGVFADDKVVAEPIFNEKYIDVLNTLGVTTLTDATAYVTRIDFAEMMMRSYGAADVAAVNTDFADVKQDDAKSGYVQLASSNGFLNGFSDGYFRPYDVITYNQVVTSLVRLVGYEPYAKIKGGYPYGYITVANELDITGGVDYKSGDSPVILADLACMLHNTLTVELLEIESVGSDSMQYSGNTGKTLLTDKMNIYMLDGQLTGTYLTTLGGSSALMQNRVMVDNSEYKTVIDLVDDIGKNMIFYIRKAETGISEIVAVMVDDNLTEVVLENENIVSISGNKITYLNQNGKKATMRITEDTDCIYNGKAKLSWDMTVFNNSDAYIRILDSDGNGDCDVVFVESYVNLTVHKVNIEDKAVFFKNSLAYPKINFDEPKRYIIYDASGEVIDFTDVSAGDILSVAISTDTSVYVIRHSSEKVSGTIESIGDKKVKISGVDYTFDTSIRSELSIATSGNFALDFRGRIVALAEDSGDLKYGYLVKMAEKAEMAYSAYAKIFTQDETFNQFELAERVNVNGTQKDEDEAYALLNAILPAESDSESAKKIKRSKSMIRYGVNANGEINKVEIASDGTSMSEGERLSLFTVDEYYDEVYYRSDKTFGHRQIISTDTVIFFIPEDPTMEELYDVFAQSDLTADLRYIYASMYDVDENFVVDAMVATVADTDYMKDNSVSGVITNITQAVNDKGDVVKKFTVLTSSGYVDMEPVSDDIEVLVSCITDISTDTDLKGENGVKKSKVSLDVLRKGDVIQYILNSDKKLTYARLLLRNEHAVNCELTNDSRHTSTNRKNNVYSMRYLCYGKIDRVFDGGFSVKVPDSNGTGDIFNRIFCIADTYKIVRYNKDRQTFEQISLSDIYPEDNVFVHRITATMKLVVIYN